MVIYENNMYLFYGTDKLECFSEEVSNGIGISAKICGSTRIDSTVWRLACGFNPIDINIYDG